MRLLDLETDIALYHTNTICELIRDKINEQKKEVCYPPEDFEEKLPMDNEIIMSLIENEFKEDFTIIKRAEDILIKW